MIFSGSLKILAFPNMERNWADEGLEKTKTGLFAKLTKAVAGKSKVDEEVLDNLEEVLVSSDVGVKTTLKIIDRIEQRLGSRLRRLVTVHDEDLSAGSTRGVSNEWAATLATVEVRGGALVAVAPGAAGTHWARTAG